MKKKTQKKKTQKTKTHFSPSRRRTLGLLGKGGIAAGIASSGLLANGCASLPDPQSVDDDTFWKLVRAQYPLTRERTYFNTGGLGPAPYPVLDAMFRTINELQSVSETGHSRVDEARVPVASLFGVSPDEVCFGRNATEGNATIASGLTFSAGDEVIFESHAHPGGSIPWLVRQKEHGVKVKIFEPDPTSAAGNLERINDLITDRTRVIQVSHVTAPTGIRMPVKEIATLAHDKGLWFHIDGAQTAGMYPFDLKDIGCDSYATSGHKWMGAPHGTGILYIPSDRLDAVIPTDAGAYSNSEYALPDQLDYNPKAQRYEAGTQDASKIVGIVAAVEFLQRIGMDRVAEHGFGLATHLQERLRQIPGITVLTPEDPSLRGSITTLKSDRVRYDDLYRSLMSDYKMRCRVVTERGLDAMRISTHLFNSMEDCDRAADAIAEIVKR